MSPYNQWNTNTVALNMQQDKLSLAGVTEVFFFTDLFYYKYYEVIDLLIDLLNLFPKEKRN